MCDQVICRKCNKPTWAGCGQHIEQVLANVAKADRCQGHPNEQKKSNLLSRLIKG